jgi:Phage X family
MFKDWLTMYQDHDQPLPFVGDRASIEIDTATGEHIAIRQPTLVHEGSFCTSIHVRISGNRVTVSGNPSRIDRLDNLFGFTSLDDCVAVYNRILLSLGLPPFTRCTRIFHRQGEDGSRVETFSDGAVITELHITSNRAVGQGCTNDYIKALSTQRYHNSIPRLHTNGNTVDWLSSRGKASLIYPSVYNKAAELRLHQLPKIARAFGPESAEYRHLLRVIDFCDSHGVSRHEQKLKSAFLRRHDFRFWGLFDPSALKPFHDDFLALDERLQVTAMELETIADKLLRLGIVTSTKAANTTTLYAMQWMAGKRFDLSNSNVRTHRARLRQIGIDIADACDISRHSPVQIRKAVEITVRDLPVPEWYQLPSVQPLRLVA